MTEKLRILLVGYNDEVLSEIKIKKDEEIVTANPYHYTYEKLPTLYSFQIIIFSPRWLKEVGTKYFEQNNKLDNFDITQFFNSPYSGCLVYPLVEKDANLFTWLPPSLHIHNSLIDRSGDDIEFNKSHWIYQFIKEVKDFTIFYWRVHKNVRVSQLSDAQRKTYIATNLADFIIAWEEKVGNSIVLFLPYFKFEETKDEMLFMRKLIDIIKKRIVSPEKTPPIWIENDSLKFDDEKELEKYVKELSKRKEVYDRVRMILWEDGYELTRSVTFVLQQMGIKCEVREERGKEDIEILEDDFKAIVEVKGLKSYANNWHLRQLMDWKNDKLMENPDIEVKGILILNHFKEAVPHEREKLCRQELGSPYPFTKEAIKIAKRENFCLLTTLQLFKLFKLFKDGKVNKNEIIELLKDTQGPLDDKKLKEIENKSVL